MKRFVAILMAAAMLLTVLAGCSGSTKPADTTPAADSSTAAAETESAAPSASAITVVLSDVGNNMDPSVANAINTFTIMSHVYDNLLNCNLDFSLQPGVIASWEQPDELTYELTVGDGFMFQNGEPLEVEDVVYSLTRLENVSQAADLYAQIDSVSAEGNVVTIVLKEANSGFIRDLVEVPVLNKSYCEEVGDAYANAPIGTGPYVMSEFVPGEKAVLTAWADYPGRRPLSKPSPSRRSQSPPPPISRLRQATLISLRSTRPIMPAPRPTTTSFSTPATRPTLRSWP